MEGIPDPVVIGIIGAPHGVRGTIRVRATGSGSHLREGVEPLVGEKRRRIRASRPTPKGYLIDLEGISSRPEASGLRGMEMILDRSELDAPEEEEYYVADLIGLEVVDPVGEVFGVVINAFQTPAHEVLVVRGQDGDASAETYIPFTMEHVPEVDLQSRRVVVLPPEG